ncbi:MAG: cupin protein [Solirubrobacterales bacterium]|nr:cupin protein [Solirubrobacterales bacterium]
MHVRNLSGSESFVTVDGSAIRELAGQAALPSVKQSLAEATLAVGGATTAHYHPVSEELYFITSGAGLMRVADEQREVVVGDCIVIPPGVEHKLTNTGPTPLTLLCCCAPPYRHEDTVLTEEPPHAPG